MREYHVRFCERPRVRSPRPTHHVGHPFVSEGSQEADRGG